MLYIYEELKKRYSLLPDYPFLTDHSNRAMYVSRAGYYYTAEKLLVHRIVYSLFNKCNLYPANVIDHIDRNPSNNSPENLRICTQQENTHNSSVPSTNTTTMKGLSIWFDPHNNKPYYQLKLRFNNTYVLNRSLSFLDNTLDYVVYLLLEYQIRFNGQFHCSQTNLHIIQEAIKDNYGLVCARFSNDF